MEKSIEFILTPKNEKIISINDLKKKYKIENEDKNSINGKFSIFDKINENSYENSSEAYKLNNKSRTKNFNLSNVTAIDNTYKYHPIENKYENNIIKNIIDDDNKSNKNLKIDENNNPNFYYMNFQNGEVEAQGSIDSKKIKSILKNNTLNYNSELHPLNLEMKLTKVCKKVSIQDHILPTCLKTKCMSILNSSNIINVSFFNILIL